MNHSFAIDGDDDHSRGVRASRETYLENGICRGVEAHEGECERELDRGQTLCARCNEIVQGNLDEAVEILLRHDRRRRAGIFTDEEKETAREALTSDQYFEFDQDCAMSEYIQELRVALRSQSIFVLAELKYGQDDLILLPQLAAEVQFWRDDRFQTVYDVIEDCAAYHLKRRDYEAWALETGRRVDEVTAQTGALAASALTVYASQVNYDHMDYELG